MFQLLHVHEEMDVSGGAALDKRPGLRAAVEAVEAGEADVIVAAYFDRLMRSLAVQAEVVQRGEAAGGAILTVDVGRVTNGSAGQWLSGTMLGAVAKYHRRATAERTVEAKQRAIERGVPPFPNLPPGLRRRPDGRLEPHPGEAPVVAEAFNLRMAGATVMGVRRYLAEHGIRRSFHGVQAMLANRLYIGELRFGSYTPNLDACEAIVDRDTFNRVQRVRVSRGRRPKSDRLLARAGVLRCGTCGASMVVGTSKQSGKLYGFYRCPPTNDCERRVTVSAGIAEEAVVEAVQVALAGVEGTASIGDDAEAATVALERAQGALDAAIRAFSDVADEPAARERLAELREARDAARDHLDRLSAAEGPAVTVTAGDWDKLTLAERRALIVAVVERATVAPGRGPDRVTVYLRGE